MSLVFSLLVYSAPLFSWGDSLYLDKARLGTVIYDDGYLSWSLCIHTDIAVALRCEGSEHSIGLRPFPIGDQKPFEAFLSGVVITPRTDASISKGSAFYCFKDTLYDKAFYNGPWDEIDGFLAGFSPSSYVSVTDEPTSGTQAIYGTLYIGEMSTFRSESGTYQIDAPPATLGTRFEALNESGGDSSLLETEGVKGILYLQGSFPLFFYGCDFDR